MQIKELREVKPATQELFKWFHPDDYDNIIEFAGKELLIFEMADGSLLGFHYREGDRLKPASYNVYELISS